jgi:hypothetical protein
VTASEREYAVWIYAPSTDAEPHVYPAGNEYWARRRAARYDHDEQTEAHVVWRYKFMPEMPWERAP